MSSNWPYPGARWWRFDFHTHTPASMDTNAWQRAVGTPDEITPEKWLLKYMAAGIDCVAVTDHNSGEWIDRLKSAYTQMKQEADESLLPPGFRDLHIFPGVEISVQGGIHVLAIFDTDASTKTITSLLGSVGFPARLHGETDDQNGAAITRDSLTQVVEKIHRCSGIAIPAHVDAEKGLLKVEPGTRKCVLEAAMVKQALQVSGLLALEWRDPQAVRPSCLDDLKLNLASVVGSDCHSFQGTSVPGSRHTWVKMAKPSLEGLRLALLDGQDVSIRRSDDSDGFSPFDKPEHFIESIEICEARVMGRGRVAAVLEFNPYFNALIGGRGTGKSTIVHALRLAYRREKDLAIGSEAGQTFTRFNKVARNRNDEGGLRADTQITVKVSRDGTLYRLIWRQDGTGHVVEAWDEATQGFKPADSQAINEQRFPIRIFSQGQIAALTGDNSQALLKIIDDAAEASTQHAAFEEAKRSFFSTRAQLRELDGKLQARDALNLSLQDVQRKLARFEVADHAAILRNYQRASRQLRELSRQFESALEQAARLKELAQELLTEDVPEGLFDEPTDALALQLIQKLRTATANARTEVERAATELSEQVRRIKTELETSAWLVQLREIKTVYDTLKSDLQQQGVTDPSEYGRLVQEKQRIENEAKRLDALQKQYEGLQRQATVQLDQVKAARQAISQRRQAFLDETLEGNRFVRMALVPYSRDPHAIERSLRDVLGAVEGKYNDDIYAEVQGEPPAAGGLVAYLLQLPKLVERPGEWNTAAFERSILEVKERLVASCKGNGDFGGWFNKFLKAEAEKRPELIDHIVCWFPEDGLEVKYSRNGDGNQFHSIAQASAGQRAAAMLAFLLAHGNAPLVLDQPEDDLDNHLIYDLVVQQIRENKQHRQLIIVTHNPNIVVNGDAELIHVLDFNSQCYVKKTGSLQDQDMRIEVCQVMEGGKEAFERRYQRLGREV